jgi:hypothetical protein
MILQAIPYFQRRFKQNSLLLKYFQACNLIVFAATILVVSLFVNRLQSDSSHTYPLRLSASLLAYISIATMLTLSTLEPFAVTPELYFAFLMTMVHFAAAANGLSQNAAFAFVAGFPRTEYAPGLMAGESLAGLLPSIIGKCIYHLFGYTQILTYLRDIISPCIPLDILRVRWHRPPSIIVADIQLFPFWGYPRRSFNHRPTISTRSQSEAERLAC